MALVSADVSIVTVAKNRLPHLLFTAPRISGCPGHREHLIVDWSSDPPIQRQALPQDARIRLLRVEGESRWSLTRAYNFAVHMARGPVILKLDADCWLTEDDQTWLNLEPGTYLRSARGGGLNGIVLVRREDFLACGGFHEGLQGYGHDDKDLYARLDQTLRCRPLPPGPLHTLDHGDSERVAAQKGLKALGPSRLVALEAIARMEESKARNRQLSESWPWSADQPTTRYQALEGGERWVAVPSSLPQGDPERVEEARALGTRVYLSILLGLPDRFLDQQIPRHELERIRCWETLLRLQARVRLLILLPLLRQGLRLENAFRTIQQRLGQCQGRS